MMKITLSILATSAMVFASSGLLGEAYTDMVKAANTKVELEKTFYTEKVVAPKVEEKVETVVESNTEEVAKVEDNTSH